MQKQNTLTAWLICFVVVFLILQFSVPLKGEVETHNKEKSICEIDARKDSLNKTDAFVGDVVTLRVKNLDKKPKAKWSVAKSQRSFAKKRGNNYIRNHKRFTAYAKYKINKIGRIRITAKIRGVKYRFIIYAKKKSKNKESKIPKEVKKKKAQQKYKSIEGAQSKARKETPILTGEGDELSGDVVIADGVKVIPGCYGSDNDNITSVTIPESVEEIECFAFSNCRNLQKITIKGNGLKYIRYAAFNGCQPGLKEFPTLPDSVEIIEDHAFTHMSNAAFKNGKFRIPKNLKLLGRESVILPNNHEKRNDGTCTTHIFYNVGGLSASPLVEFTGESTNYIAIDGILYRKKSKYDKKPVFLVSIPSGKRYFDKQDGSGAKEDGVYSMPDTVRGAAELSLNNSNKSIKRIVFGNQFQISKRCDEMQEVSYNISMFYKGKSYSNAVTIMGGYGNKNLVSYGVKETNPKYTEYSNCIFSKNGDELWAVPPAIEEVTLCANTSKIDSGAFQQSMFGTPYNTNTGDSYAKWANDSKAVAWYQTLRNLKSLACNKYTLNWIQEKTTDVSHNIIVHTIQTVMKNSNANFKVKSI